MSLSKFKIIKTLSPRLHLSLKSFLLTSAAVMLMISNYYAQSITCGTTITNPGVYTLNSNLICNGTEPVITINANDVVLDLNGYSISVSSGQNGIVVANSSNVLIKNGTINGIGYSGNGILVGGTINGLNISNIKASNFDIGLYFIYDSQLSSIAIVSDTLSNNNYGIYLDQRITVSDFFTVYLNNLTDNIRSAFHAQSDLNYSDGLFLKQNDVSGSCKIDGFGTVEIFSLSDFILDSNCFHGFNKSANTPNSSALLLGNVSNVDIIALNLSNDINMYIGHGLTVGGKNTDLNIEVLNIMHRDIGLHLIYDSEFSGTSISTNNFSDNNYGIFVNQRIIINSLFRLHANTLNNNIVSAFTANTDLNKSLGLEIINNFVYGSAKLNGSSAVLFYALSNFTIDSNCFNGFYGAAVSPTASAIALNNTENVTVQHIDLSYDGSDGSMRIGSGLSLCGTNIALTVLDVTAMNRDIGLQIFYDSQFINSQFLQNTFNNNSYGTLIHPRVSTIGDFTFRNNTITQNSTTGFFLSQKDDNFLFYDNNIYNNTINFSGNEPCNLFNSQLKKGNYWGHSCPVPFYAHGGPDEPFDTNIPGFVDSYAYGTKDAWTLSPESIESKPCVVQLQSGIISGSVKVNSVGLRSVILSLYRVANNSNTFLGQAITDSQGNFTFNNLISGIYLVTIPVIPYGYSISSNYQYALIDGGNTVVINFYLLKSIAVNMSNKSSYWTKQFDYYLNRKGKAKETSADLTKYMNMIQYFYSNKTMIFKGYTTFHQWYMTLDIKNNASILDKVKEQLAAFLFNLAANYIAQYIPVTQDNRTAGEALTFVTHIIKQNLSNQFNIAYEVLNNINSCQKIASGIIPPSEILYDKQNDNSIVMTAEMPYEFSLLQNYPNPFNPVTTIEYSIPLPGFVKLIVFDSLGNQITTLVNESKSSGLHRTILDGNKLSSGIYIYQLLYNNKSITKKMLLIK
ncbi:MAG TPA: T9SS type A sorting domain-containing protein [Ignavibacteriaceae bacterium]|nr:T9SS type A sorting domain-containing protein [Ignavibacteriaceae bacterium]